MAQGILPGDQNFAKAIGGTSSATDSANSIRSFQYNPTNRGMLVHIAGADVDINVDIAEVTSTFDHGRNSDVDTTAEQLTSTSVTATKGVLVKAANSNTANVFVGNSDLTADSADATDGFELGPGESILLKVNNANLVYVRAAAVNQVVYWLAV